MENNFSNTRFQILDQIEKSLFFILVIDPLAEPGRLSVGFAKIPITPQVTDTWNDFNNNAKYEPEQGETYNDVNGNNKFDPNRAVHCDKKYIHQRTYPRMYHHRRKTSQ